MRCSNWTSNRSHPQPLHPESPAKIGGYAVCYHGYHRSTAGIDFWIAVPQDNARNHAIFHRLIHSSRCTQMRTKIAGALIRAKETADLNRATGPRDAPHLRPIASGQIWLRSRNRSQSPCSAQP